MVASPPCPAYSFSASATAASTSPPLSKCAGGKTIATTPVAPQTQKMKSLRTRTRVALSVLALALIGAEAYWFTRAKPVAEPDFELKLTSSGVRLDRVDRKNIPLFDPIKLRWTVGGLGLASLLPMRVLDKGDVQPMAGEYVIVSLPPHATPAIFRKALLALSNEGICYFAVLDEEDSSPSKVDQDAPIYGIKDVRSNNGQMVACHPSQVPMRFQKL